LTLAQAAALIDTSRTLPDMPLHAGLKDPRRPASLMHAYIVVSLMSGMRPEEARAISWVKDVSLDGNGPQSLCCEPTGPVGTPRPRSPAER
jgi:hypothetical protein